MRGAAVVPHHHIARPPAVPQYELGLEHVLVQQAQQSVALDARQAQHMGGEPRIHEQVLPARDRVDAHHGVDHRRHLLGVVVQTLHIVAPQRGVERLAPVGQWRDAMDGLELFHGGAQGGVESFIGAARIGPQRVATGGRGDIAHQYRYGGRHGDEGDIGMPPRIAPACCAVEFEDLRMVGVAGHHRVGRGEFAEAATERNLFGMGEELVAEHQQQVFGQQRAHPVGVDPIGDARVAEFETEGSGDRCCIPGGGHRVSCSEVMAVRSSRHAVTKSGLERRSAAVRPERLNGR